MYLKGVKMSLEKITEECYQGIEMETIFLPWPEAKRIVERHLNAARIEMVRAGRLEYYLYAKGGKIEAI
jgi:hypothetical protein